jgi:putative membrane protein
MLDILLFLALGVVFGIIMGLIPGIHPNMIILAVPVLAALNLGSMNVLAFIVSMGITNSIVDFIPSILLGAPDPGKELAVLPGHRLLLNGYGYEAIKLSVIGSLGGIIFVAVAFPLLMLVIPSIYAAAGPYIYIFLVSIVLLMILSEHGKKKIYAAAVFFSSGLIGLIINRLPIDATMILFPVFAGFFAVSMLLLQLRSNTKIPKQRQGQHFISSRLVNKSVIFGSLGGIAAGFLPGVGSSEIATIATVDKNEKSFLITVGALTTANTILSIVCLFLINRTRSGLAVAINQLVQIGFSDVFFIIAVSVVSAGIGCAITLFTAKKFASKIVKINYSMLSVAVISLIFILTLFFTGILGLILLAVCTALGIAANLQCIKRGSMMGVLILPTILFYIGI